MGRIPCLRPTANVREYFHTPRAGERRKTRTERPRQREDTKAGHEEAAILAFSPGRAERTQKNGARRNEKRRKNSAAASDSSLAKTPSSGDTPDPRRHGLACLLGFLSFVSMLVMWTCGRKPYGQVAKIRCGEVDKGLFFGLIKGLGRGRSGPAGAGQVPERLKGMGCKPIGVSLRRFDSYPVHTTICGLLQGLILCRLTRVNL